MYFYHEKHEKHENLSLNPKNFKISDKERAGYSSERTSANHIRFWKSTIRHKYNAKNEHTLHENHEKTRRPKPKAHRFSKSTTRNMQHILASALVPITSDFGNLRQGTHTHTHTNTEHKEQAKKARSNSPPQIRTKLSKRASDPTRPDTHYPSAERALVAIIDGCE